MQSARRREELKRIEKLKINIVQAASIVGVIVLAIFLFINFTQQGKDSVAWISQNGTGVLIACLLLAAVYFYMQNQIKPAWADPWEVLKAACNHPEGGFRTYGFRYKELCSYKHPILITRIEPHMAYLFTGTVFFESGKCYTFMLDGRRPAKGGMLQAWPYELAPREVKELQKSGVSLEEAYTKIREVKQLDNAVREGEE